MRITIWLDHIVFRRMPNTLVLKFICPKLAIPKKPLSLIFSCNLISEYGTIFSPTSLSERKRAMLMLRKSVPIISIEHLLYEISFVHTSMIPCAP